MQRVINPVVTIFKKEGSHTQPKKKVENKWIIGLIKMHEATKARQTGQPNSFIKPNSQLYQQDQPKKAWKT